MRGLPFCVLLFIIIGTNSFAASVEDAMHLVEENRFEEAIHILELEANKNDHEAQYELGKIIFYSGKGEKDPTKGANLLREAASSGNIKAIRELGLIYYNGWFLDVKRYDAARAMFEIGANAGDAESKYYLGNMYLSGLDVKIDHNKALYYYKQASLSGCKKANFKIGYLYCIESSSVYNLRLAKEYLKKIYKESAPSSFLLALICSDDDGCSDEDYFKYIKTSHDLGFHHAIARLADCYFSGIGVQRDFVKAINLYKEGSFLGNVDCMNKLAYLYAEGIIVPCDQRMARSYLNRASCASDNKVDMFFDLEH